MERRIKHWVILAALCASIAACKSALPPPIADLSQQVLPPISKQLSCLPTDAAFIAAHRGTSKGSPYPENSMSGLLALIDKGYYFAEIDIAAIQDGTHILFHDNEWDEKSSGVGAINATTRANYEVIRLKDTSGELRTDKVALFDDILNAAKNKIYLEIDFKSSSKYETVISTIREAGMDNQVILIAYSPGQASKLAHLAPNMMISVSAKTDVEIRSYTDAGVATSNIAVWRGRSGVNSKLLDTLRSEGIPILRQAPKSGPKKTAKVANVIVSDYAFDFSPIIGLTKTSKMAYQDCLIN